MRVDAEVLDVVELGRHALEVAHAVVVGIEERLDVQLVDDRVLVPERIVVRVDSGFASAASSDRQRGFMVWVALDEVVEVALGAHARRSMKMWTGARCGSSITKLCEPFQSKR